jgi:hypothetical protein
LNIQEIAPDFVREIDLKYEANAAALYHDWGIMGVMIVISFIITFVLLHRISKDTR